MGTRKIYYYLNIIVPSFLQKFSIGPDGKILNIVEDYLCQYVPVAPTLLPRILHNPPNIRAPVRIAGLLIAASTSSKYGSVFFLQRERKATETYFIRSTFKIDVN